MLLLWSVDRERICYYYYERSVCSREANRIRLCKHNLAIVATRRRSMPKHGVLPFTPSTRIDVQQQWTSGMFNLECFARNEYLVV